MVPRLARELRLRNEPELAFWVRELALFSRVVYRLEITETEAEVNALLEEAASEALSQCPEAVMAIYIYCRWHGGRDRVASAEDRVQLTEAALARLDPSQKAYIYLSEERALALRDLSKSREALEAANKLPMTSLIRAHLQLGFGFKAEAYESLKASKGWVFRGQGEPSTDPSSANTVFWTLLRARAGSSDLPLPTAQVMKPWPFLYADWTQLKSKEFHLKANPDASQRLDQDLARFGERLLELGAPRSALELSEIRFQLAKARGRRFAMARALRAFSEAGFQLPNRLDAARPRRKLQAALDRQTLRERLTAESSDAFLQQSQALEPEEAEAQIALARKRWPQDGRLAVAAAELARALGESAATWTADLHAFVKAEPEATEAAAFLMEAWVQGKNAADLKALEPDLGPDSRALYPFYAAEMQMACGDREAARASFEALVLAHPEATLPALRLCELEDPEAGLLSLDRLIEAGRGGEEAHWIRLRLATDLGDAARIRSSALALGMKLSDGEAAIALQDPELLWLQFESPDAERLLALRVEPLVARVLSMHLPGEGFSRLDDRYVFDPKPLSMPSPTEPLFAYRALQRLSKGAREVFEFRTSYSAAAFEALEAIFLRLDVEMSGLEKPLEAGARIRILLGLPAGLARDPLNAVADALEAYRAQSGFPGVYPELSARAERSLGRQADEMEALRLSWPE